MSASLVEMAKELVRELIQAGQLLPNDVQNALQSTYQSLMELKRQEETGFSTAATPGTVDWRKSITRNAVTCLECGQTFRHFSLTFPIMQRFPKRMTPAQSNFAPESAHYIRDA